MASPPSSTRRALRALLITGFLWLLTCWTYAIHRIIAAAPPVTPLLKNHHNLHDEHAVSSDIRKLDQSSSASDVSINSISDFQIKQRSPTATQEKSLPAAPKTHLVFPLHAKSGTHHAYLYVGSPPQRQTLIVDTGSRLTAFPCKPFCSTCGIHASPRFDMNTSTSLSIVPCDECMLSRKDFELETYFKGDGVGGNSGDGDVNVDLMPDQVKRARLRGANANKRRTSHKSCKKSQCEINQRYTEGSSWDAIEVRDNVWLGFEDINESNLQHAQYSKPFVFGCQTSEEGLFQSQYADGIMGLSMYTQTIVGSWFKQGSIQHETFSLCFNSNGGHMSLGGVASTHDENYKNDNGAIHSTPMQYIPLARDNTWYYTVHVTSISIGDHVLPSDALQFMNDHKGTIVDSGTTDTFLSHKVAKAFTLAWAKLVKRKYDNKFQQYSYADFMKLPVITFEFDGGTKWDVRPEAYMEAANKNYVKGTQWQGKRSFTSRIYVDEPHGAVLGANMMMDHDIYFDSVNRRLGVARATCSF